MQAFYLNNELPKPQNLSEALGIVSDYQMQELTTEHRFKLLGIGHQRRKYWGEPKDCSSHYQVLKDTFECKRQEWLLHQQGKSDKNKPVFSIKLEDAKQEAKSKLDASGIVGCSYKSAQHALVDNFQEYENLKERERASY